jgi:general secretion pathway protein M
MNALQRFESLDPRERRLLRVFMVCIAALAIVLVPIGTEAMLRSKRDESESYANAIKEILASQPALAKAEQKRQAIAQRYAKPAPPLATFIDALARELTLDVPESQDRPTVPHGKRYEERAIRLQLRKVGLANLATFLEKIEAVGHPIVISKLDIKRRITEADSYDVDMIVSAYDRKELPKSESESGKGDATSGDKTPTDKTATDARKEEP